MAAKLRVAKLLGTLVLFLSLFALVTPRAEASPGVASWYDLTGNYTASGDILEANDRTCASNTFPFGTHLLVTYNGVSAHCRVTDTGGFTALGRDLDVNVYVGQRLGIISTGVAPVQIQVVGYDENWFYGRQY